ncbi:hypothetical protein [Weissella paramesenteroides]|uniref:hypothetical protein n=1 Tax=Weissella paramesenteroides TaxID=1249 RepID=UPI00223BAF08|nr:hypothetical protein [Weissella paramesenteroides]
MALLTAYFLGRIGIEGALALSLAGELWKLFSFVSEGNTLVKRIAVKGIILIKG